MTDQQILDKAIKKAIRGGFKPLDIKDEDFNLFGTQTGDGLTEAVFNRYEPPSLFTLIFNHDFAKALWGESKEINSSKEFDYKRTGHGFNKPRTLGWQYHLQQMVIAEDPIKYLGEHGSL